jgi:hypothetical protein
MQEQNPRINPNPHYQPIIAAVNNCVARGHNVTLQSVELAIRKVHKDAREYLVTVAEALVNHGYHHA